jgi:hypothetical protein
MDFLVKYVVFYPDHHQGGSGKHFEHSSLVTIESDHKVGDVRELIHEKIEPSIKKATSGWPDWKYIIKSIEVFNG